MKAQLGRPTGLALALLATLLAALLAMGAFSVAQASEHSATRSFSPATTVAPETEMTVTIELSAYGGIGGSVAETLPTGFILDYDSVDWEGGRAFDASEDTVVRVLFRSGGVTSVTYKVTAPSEPGGPFDFTGNFVNSAGESEGIHDASGGASMVTVEAATNGGNGGGNGETGTGITLSSYEPGAAVQITIKDSAATAITPNQDIRVDLADFSVPSTIAESAVDISSDGTVTTATPAMWL